MKRLASPPVWLLMGLLLLAVAGAVLLAQDGSTASHAKDMRFYWARHYWQASFDSLSAVCGCGLLTYDFNEQYTDQGRWILTALGQTGALLYLAGLISMLRRWPGARDEGVPHFGWVLLWFIGMQGLLVGLSMFLVRPGDVAHNTWLVSAAFASLGWTPTEPGFADLPTWAALLSFLSALGWSLPLILVAPASRRRMLLAGFGRLFAVYCAFLIGLVVLVAAFEAPRATVTRAPTTQTGFSADHLSLRASRAAAQVVAAGGAGMPVTSLAEGQISEGSRIGLSIAVLVGPLGNAAGGGITFAVLWLAFSAAFWPSLSTLRSETRLGGIAALSAAASLVALAGVVTFGLLLIENVVASPYQPVPSFAAAFLDACSAVAGGNLSSGVFADVTSRNLTSGIRLGINLYSIGMLWFMAAMVAGRVVPVWILNRFATQACQVETR